MAKYTELVNGKRVQVKMVYGKVINNEKPGHNLKFRIGLTPYRVAHGTTAWFPRGIIHLFENSTYEIFVGAHDIESNEPPQKQKLQRYEFYELTPPEVEDKPTKGKNRDKLIAQMTGATMSDVVKNKQPIREPEPEIGSIDLASDVLQAVENSEMTQDDSPAIEAGVGEFGGAGSSGEY